MNYIDIKDMKMSEIILGTDGYSQRIDKETAYALMDLYIEQGGNVFDTARLYCGGGSEKLIGEYIREKNCRDKVYISTKCSHPPLGNMTQSRLDKNDIEYDVNLSLEALGVEYIDLLWLHRDDESKDAGPIIEALNDLIKSGKIRHFGASNWTHDRITEANIYAEKNGLEGFCASQILYNMATCSTIWDNTLVVLQGEEKEKYNSKPFPVFAFCSQAKGFFEKYASNSLSEKSAHRYLNDETVKTFHEIKKRSDETGNTISHTALQMLIEQSGFDVLPIIGPSSTEQLKSTLNI